MTFRQQIIATLIGAFFGFIFGLVVFLFQEVFRDRMHKKQLIKNLISEFNYNVAVIFLWTKALEYNIEQIENYDQSKEVLVLNHIDSSKMSRIAIDKCISEGNLYDIFRESIGVLNSILYGIPVRSETMNRTIKAWQRSNKIENKTNIINEIKKNILWYNKNIEDLNLLIDNLKNRRKSKVKTLFSFYSQKKKKKTKATLRPL